MSRRNRRGRNKNKKVNTKIVLGIIVIVIIIIITIFGINKISNFLKLNVENNKEKTDEHLEETTDLEVYFIDVGQADSILVLKDKQAMLIDAGNDEDGENIVNFIKDKGIQTLNYVIRNTSTRESHRRFR